MTTGTNTTGPGHRTSGDSHGSTPSPARAFDPLTVDSASGIAYRLRPASIETPIARVLLLHGVGGNETNLESLAGLLDPRIEVVLVRGPLTFGPAQHGFFEVSFQTGAPTINAAQADRSRRALIELLQSLRGAPAAQAAHSATAQTTTHAVTPVIIGGFSQGGILSASVALTAPDEVRGFAVLSGRILPEIEPSLAPREALARISALIAHGEFDSKLPVQWAERSDAWLGQLGVRLTSHRYPIGHEINADVAADFVRWIDDTLSLS